MRAAAVQPAIREADEAEGDAGTCERVTRPTRFQGMKAFFTPRSAGASARIVAQEDVDMVLSAIQSSPVWV